MPCPHPGPERLLVRLAQLPSRDNDLQTLGQLLKIRTTREISSVPEIHAIFWDVGGVLLSNAWDHTQRIAALEHFRLDEEEFHSRHEMVVSSFERGKITLDEYLDRTVFYRNRPFTRAEFRDFMLHGIEKCGLREIFRLFVSSCFVGLRKPESGIYRLSIEITQINPEECCFIDDRALNLECAAKMGMQTIQMETLGRLQEDLGRLGVKR